MFKRLSPLLPLLLLCVLLIPSQPAFARFNSLPDLFNLGTEDANSSSWPVDASATCTTVTVELSYPTEQNPIGIPDPYDSVTWSLERVLVNGSQEVPVADADKTIYTFPYDTPAGETHSRTFTLATPLEAGTGLFIEVAYAVNGGDFGGNTGIFDVGDFDHPYWHMRAHEPAHSLGSLPARQHFCADNSSAPSVYVLGDVAQKEGNGGLQTYPYKLFLSHPTDQPVRIDIESDTAAGLPDYPFTRASFNGYSSRGIEFGSAVCIDSDLSCIAPTYTTIIIPPGETQATLPLSIGSDTSPEVYFNWPHDFQIIRVANAKFGGKISAVAASRNDDGCNGYGAPQDCYITLIVPGGSIPDVPIDRYSFLVSNQTVDETAGSVTFTVTLTDPVDYPIDIQYETTSTGYNATADDDYTPVSGTLNFPANVLSQDIVVPIIANPQAEGLEAFGLRVWKTGGVNNSDEVTVGALIVNDYVGPTPTSTPTNTPTVAATETPIATAEVSPTPTIEAAGVELLVNGDFERHDENDSPDLAPWKLKNESRDKVKCNKAVKVFARTGECAYMFRGSTGESTTLSQEVAIEAFNFAENDTLTLNAYVNAKGAASGKIKVRVKYVDATLDKGRITVDLLQTSGYQLVTGSVELLSGEVAKLKVTLSHRTPSGKVYVDTVSLRQTSGSRLLQLP